jgi:hypothetical protein
MMINPLQFCLSDETEEIVDLILGEFLLSCCIGKNDMNVANGLITSAAIIVATHCERTGQDFQELSALFRNHFELGLKIAGEQIQKRTVREN